jgi:hypothetical protein
MRPLKLRSSRGGSNGSNGAALLAAGSGSNGDGSHPVSISLLAEYPVRGWVVEGPSLAGMAQVSSCNFTCLVLCCHVVQNVV